MTDKIDLTIQAQDRATHTIEALTENIKGLGDEIAKQQYTLQRYGKDYDSLTESQRGQIDTEVSLLQAYNGTTEAIEDKSAVTQEATEATKENKQATEEVTDSYDRLNTIAKVSLGVFATLKATMILTANEFGKFDGISIGFERNFGDMEQSLQKFRNATAGTISDMNLMMVTNKASM